MVKLRGFGPRLCLCEDDASEYGRPSNATTEKGHVRSTTRHATADRYGLYGYCLGCIWYVGVMGGDQD